MNDSTFSFLGAKVVLDTNLRANQPSTIGTFDLLKYILKS